MTQGNKTKTMRKIARRSGVPFAKVKLNTRIRKYPTPRAWGEPRDGVQLVMLDDMLDIHEFKRAYESMHSPPIILTGNRPEDASNAPGLIGTPKPRAKRAPPLIIPDEALAARARAREGRRHLMFSLRHVSEFSLKLLSWHAVYAHTTIAFLTLGSHLSANGAGYGTGYGVGNGDGFGRSWHSGSGHGSGSLGMSGAGSGFGFSNHWGNGGA